MRIKPQVETVAWLPAVGSSAVHWGASLLTVGVVAVVALAVVIGFGTSGPTGPSGSGGQVQVWAVQDPQNEPIIRAGIAQYHEATGADLKLTTYVNDPYKQKLQVSMGSPNAPDVFFNWGAGNLAQFVEAEQVQELSTALTRKPAVAEKFLPSVLAGGTVRGRQYGLPFNGMQPVVLYYNKAVLQRLGVKPPTTYDELLSAVDTIKAGGVTPIVLPGSQGWTELMYLEYLLDRVGGPGSFAAIESNRPGAWRDPALLTALRMCQTLVRRGAFGTSFSSTNYDNTGASAVFATGRAAMFLMGSWEYTNLAKRQPEFFASGNLGWTAFPAVAGGAGDPRNIVGNPSNYFSVRAGGRHTGTAINFLMDTLTSDPYVDELIKSGQVPAIKGVDARLAGTPNAAFTTFVYGLVAQAPTFTQSWDQALSPSVSTQLLTNVQRLFLSEITPEQFVAVMERAQ